MDTVKDMRIDANKQGPPGYIEVLLNVENDHQIHKDIYKKNKVHLVTSQFSPLTMIGKYMKI